MAKTKEYQIVNSDRISLVDAAVDVVINMRRRIRPSEEWKATELSKLEQNAYDAALRLLIKEFNEGPTEITKEVVLDTKD